MALIELFMRRFTCGGDSFVIQYQLKGVKTDRLRQEKICHWVPVLRHVGPHHVHVRAEHLWFVFVVC